MNLILWRHADAETLSEHTVGSGDLARVLTARGHKQAQASAAWLRAHLDRHARILVSPAVRTVQTAQALETPYEIVRDLAPGADAATVLGLAGWPDGPDGPGDTVIVVGHQPTLGRVASLLLAGVEANWSVRKSGIWWLSNRRREDEAQVVLRAVVNPDLLP
jgi:phosphohistidine phosphatase